MNARSLLAAWAVTLALTIFGAIGIAHTQNAEKTPILTSTMTTVCVALDTVWSCK